MAACAVVIGKALLALPSDTPVPRFEPAHLEVGTTVATDSVHPIGRPGLYGLGEPPEGSHYAVISGNLVRVDAGSGTILAVLRPMMRPLNEADFD